jgi:hypothetical protein
MFAFIHSQEDFLFLSLCTLCDFIDATSSLRIDVTSSSPLRLHVDRGLVRHGYPRVTTDQGLSRPRKAGPTYQKTHRPDVWAQDMKVPGVQDKTDYLG